MALRSVLRTGLPLPAGAAPRVLLALGLRTALVYPTLVAVVADAASPLQRVQVVGVYRFWRDAGFVAGALVVGAVVDAVGSGAEISLVAALTAASGVWVGVTRWHDRPAPAPAPELRRA